MNKYTFYDIFDSETLQKLMDSLSATLHVRLKICGPQGEALTRHSGPCALCKEAVTGSSSDGVCCEQSVLELCSLQVPSPHI